MKLSGLPVNPPLVAVTVVVVAEFGSNKLTAHVPFAPVVQEAAESVPSVVLQVTAVPETFLLLESRTSTTRGVGSQVLRSAFCLFPATMRICVAAPAAATAVCVNVTVVLPSGVVHVAVLVPAPAPMTNRGE